MTHKSIIKDFSATCSQVHHRISSPQVMFILYSLISHEEGLYESYHFFLSSKSWLLVSRATYFFQEGMFLSRTYMVLQTSL